MRFRLSLQCLSRKPVNSKPCNKICDGIIPCFLKNNPRGHCVKNALQTEDDNEISIFTSLRAKAASGQ